MKRIIFVFFISLFFLTSLFASEEGVIIKRLKKYLSLKYKRSDIILAYNEFYPKKYKLVLKKYRKIDDAEEYAASEPKVDFVSVITLKKIDKVEIKGARAYVTALSEFYDLEKKTRYKERQTFTMLKEDGRWVYGFHY